MVQSARLHTSKSLPEALIFAFTNPQYDDIFFIELQVQYMKIPSTNRVRTCCVQILFLTFRKFFVHNMFSPCFGNKEELLTKVLAKHAHLSVKLYISFILTIMEQETDYKDLLGVI